MGVHGVGIGAAVVIVLSASVESPSFHAGSLVTELLHAESCAASAALHSVSDSQLAWYENQRQTSSPLVGTTR